MQFHRSDSDFQLTGNTRLIGAVKIGYTADFDQVQYLAADGTTWTDIVSGNSSIGAKYVAVGNTVKVIAGTDADKGIKWTVTKGGTKPTIASADETAGDGSTAKASTIFRSLKVSIDVTFE